jgi:hypothetical protein
MSISLYDCGASTILILPLAAMHEEYKSRAKQHGLTCKTWTSDCDLATAPQLLLVAVENCPWPVLQASITTLIRLGRLARIVVDEAHLLEKHEPFRPCMAMLSFFGTLAISILLMTATYPHSLEKELFEKLGRKVYQVLRRSTDRPEISQAMIPVQADLCDFEEIVAKNVASATRLLKDAERGLLFCNSRDECDRMAKLLGWRPYHSSISIEERSEAMKLWKGGAVVGLVCTSMLNCCLDYPYVRYVFHLGPPRDVVDYYQAIGRAARAGGIGTAVVYFNPAFLWKPAGDGNDPFGRRIIYDMLCDASLCRRLRPGFFLDGIGVPCVMLPHAQLCDLCMAQSSCQLPDSGLRPIPDHLAPTLPSCRLNLNTLEPCKPAEPPAQLALLPNPLNQPAPSATFANHLAAANACLAFGRVRSTHTEDLARSIRIACDNLAKSCVICWSNGFEYHSHCLAECHWRPIGLCDENWRKWESTLRLPVGCCFYCGCPQKVRTCYTTVAQSSSNILLDGLCDGFWSEASCA